MCSDKCYRSSTYPARGPSDYQPLSQQQNSAQPVSPRSPGPDGGYAPLRPPLVTRATMPHLTAYQSDNQYVSINRAHFNDDFLQG